MNIHQVMESVKHLSYKDKALVAHCLISSLENSQDEGVDDAWSALAEKRYEELTSGTVETVSWEDIKASVKES